MAKDELKIHMLNVETKRYPTQRTMCEYVVYLLEGRVTTLEEEVTCKHCLKQIEIAKRNG